MSSREFSEWQIFDSMEPGYPTREDHLFALVASVVANSNRSKKRRKPYAVQDFLIRFKSTAGRLMNSVTPEQVQNKMKLFFSMYQGNRDKQGKKK